MQTEATTLKQSDVQKKSEGKSSKPSPWTKVNVDQMEKFAAGLKQYEAEKKGTVAPKKKKGK